MSLLRYCKLENGPYHKSFLSLLSLLTTPTTVETGTLLPFHAKASSASRTTEDSRPRTAPSGMGSTASPLILVLCTCAGERWRDVGSAVQFEADTAYPRGGHCIFLSAVAASACALFQPVLLRAATSRAPHLSNTVFHSHHIWCWVGAKRSRMLGRPYQVCHREGKLPCRRARSQLSRKRVRR